MARAPKDWDKIVRDFEEEEKKAGVVPNENEFLSSLYANADDDARRAMIKSMQQSHGTKLIMNWNEVKDGDVKPYEDDDPNEKSIHNKAKNQTKGAITFTREDLLRMKGMQSNDSDSE